VHHDSCGTLPVTWPAAPPCSHRRSLCQHWTPIPKTIVVPPNFRIDTGENWAYPNS